jgi:hypothetical protein
MSFSAPPSVPAIARRLPVPAEDAVRDIIAVAGGDLPQALARIGAALGCLVAERVDPALHALLLGAAARVAAEHTVLRSAGRSGRG